MTDNTDRPPADRLTTRRHKALCHSSHVI